MAQAIWQILTAIIRLGLVALVTHLATAGYLKIEQISPYYNDIVGFIATAIAVLLGVAWSFIEKWRKGLLPNSPFPPTNLPSITMPTKVANTIGDAINPTPEKKDP